MLTNMIVPSLPHFTGLFRISMVVDAECFYDTRSILPVKLEASLRCNFVDLQQCDPMQLVHVRF